MRDREEHTMAKYCTQCGKRLEDEEVCTCTSQSNGTVQTASAQTSGSTQAQAHLAALQI